MYVNRNDFLKNVLVGELGEIYRNFSINCQTICDNNMKILDIVCRWPGSAHDSTIFNNSKRKNTLETTEFKNFHIVGDKGYPLKTYCLTPINNPTNDAEMLYNESIIRTSLKKTCQVLVLT